MSEITSTNRSLFIPLPHIIFFLLSIWGFIGLVSCKNLDQLLAEPRIVWVELNRGRTAEDMFNLNLNIDVWEVSKKHLVIRTTDNVIRKLRQNEYLVVVLYATEEDYYETINNGVVPVRIARINCETAQQCQEVGATVAVSGIVDQQNDYVIVKVTDQQLLSLLEQNYNAHLLYATEQDYLNGED